MPAELTHLRTTDPMSHYRVTLNYDLYGYSDIRDAHADLQLADGFAS